MAKKRSSRASKTVRASVSRRTRSGTDPTKRSEASGRAQIWVGGYRREDGTRVEGYYRASST